MFEICSVGSCLLVDDLISDQLNKLGFIDNVNCIMCNKDNMETKIRWILNKKNRHRVDLIRKRGMDLVKTNHNTNNRANQFNTIINNEYLDNNLFYCNYNNEIYFTPDQIQVEYINSGRAEPYSGNIEIIKDYIKLTNRNNTYIDVGVNIATHSIVI